MFKKFLLLSLITIQPMAMASDCKITFIELEDSITKNINFKNNVSFIHPKNKLEEYKVKLTKHSIRLEIKNLLNTSGDEFIKYDVKCQSNMSCSGERNYLSKTHKRKQKFEIQGQTYASIAKIKNREIFHYEIKKNKSNLFYLKYKLKGKKIGTLVSCRHKHE